MTSAIGLHRRRSCIAPWPTTLATSFGPIARCNGSLGRSFLTRSNCKFAASCRTSPRSRWRTSSTDSSVRGTSSGRATCTTIFRRLMIRKSLFRRVARRSLRGGRIVGRGSALIFRRPIMWKKKTLLHHSGSRPFSYRMDARRRTLGRRPGTYYRGMGNARQREPRPRPAAQSSQVTALTAEVATLRSQMSVILESLARSGIPVPQFDTATSEPVRSEHLQQTTAPAQTSEPHVPEDNVDFSTLFD
ncbi:unnamed protein product [Prunus brigantina]